MSKSSFFKEIGMSPIEENIDEKCYDKDKSDNKAHLSTSDILSIETEDHRYHGYIADLKSGDYHSSVVGKKLNSDDKFPCLKSYIAMYLDSYFSKNPGPSKYDYYLEIIYDDFRVQKMKHKEEDKWNVKGLVDFLNTLNFDEYLKSLKEPPPLPPRKACVEVLTEKENEDYEEHLCNIFHGITLEEYRALNERDEKNNSSGEKSKEKKKKKSRWKRFLSCFNCFKCVKSQQE